MKHIYITLGFTLIGALLGWFARDLARPEYPKHWDNLQLGMSANEAHLMVPKLHSAKEEDRDYMDYGDRHWDVCVTYDSTGNISSIYKRYVDHRFGLMNKIIKSPYKPRNK